MKTYLKGLGTLTLEADLLLTAGRAPTLINCEREKGGPYDARPVLSADKKTAKWVMPITEKNVAKLLSGFYLTRGFTVTAEWTKQDALFSKSEQEQFAKEDAEEFKLLSEQAKKKANLLEDVDQLDKLLKATKIGLDVKYNQDTAAAALASENKDKSKRKVKPILYPQEAIDLCSNSLKDLGHYKQKVTRTHFPTELPGNFMLSENCWNVVYPGKGYPGKKKKGPQPPKK
jgi:hypothetical protein